MTRKTQPRKPGRPKIQLTASEKKLIEKCGKIGATQEETAGIVGISVDTLSRHFADLYKRGTQQRNYGLRRRQFEVAMKGNVTMLIWLGKQYLGQAEGAMPEDFITQLRESISDKPMNSSRSKP